jgi:hypothetical protein
MDCVRQGAERYSAHTSQTRENNKISPAEKINPRDILINNDRLM